MDKSGGSADAGGAPGGGAAPDKNYAAPPIPAAPTAPSGKNTTAIVAPPLPRTATTATVTGIGTGPQPAGPLFAGTPGATIVDANEALRLVQGVTEHTFSTWSMDIRVLGLGSTDHQLGLGHEPGAGHHQSQRHRDIPPDLDLGLIHGSGTYRQGVADVE